MNQSPCKGCGKMILWGKDEDGKKIPLDPSAPVYFVVDEETESILGFSCTKVDNKNEHNGLKYYVSHFSTCPKANDFSASKRKKATP